MQQIGSVREIFEAESAEASNCVLMLSFPPPPPSEVAEALSFANRTVIDVFVPVCGMDDHCLPTATGKRYVRVMSSSVVW